MEWKVSNKSCNDHLFCSGGSSGTMMTAPDKKND